MDIEEFTPLLYSPVGLDLKPVKASPEDTLNPGYSRDFLY